MNGIEIQYRKRIETAFLLDALTSILSTVTPLMKLEKRKVMDKSPQNGIPESGTVGFGSISIYFREKSSA
jgi:hypothetical protein